MKSHRVANPARFTATRKRLAAAGVPLRTLQEWMGHRDIKTTQIYADYQPSPTEQELVDRAFGSTTVDAQSTW